MKVLHTSDWHLGQQFYEHSRHAEHQFFLDWLCNTLTSHQIDVLIVSGDIYHSATPSAMAEQQLYAFIRRAKTDNPNLHIVITAGNHDSANRIETAKPLLSQFDTHVVGRFDKHTPQDVVKTLSTANGTLQVVAMPFLRSADLEAQADDPQAYQRGVARAYQAAYQTLDAQLPVLAMGHLHAKGGSISGDSERNITIGGFDAITADVFGERPDYVALGHLHKAQKVAGSEAIRYCGTPLPMSFSERNYRHQVLLVEFTNNALSSVKPLDVPRLKQVILLPERGGATLDELMTLLSELDLSQYQDTATPYLRLRLNASETDSQFRHKIEQALTDKPVHFCGIERVSNTQQAADEPHFEDLGQVEKLEPVSLLELAYRAQIDSEQAVPQALQDCLMQVLASVQEREA
ncbi:exonuclease SbcCD subunit D C-terminal domain-containing protein [Pseudoalteromonas sp. DL2-H2.2]|uniref:exonuclease SbcCD subunit D C-terminal domain-containing protein n=1 Tax=Pseudoalteromonas sp. DL2-H2.2 TaxID=2908889 RepID=UPI001F2C73E9|nr:exonuclease SbcCD subunit D C-terminal domain-containing protein [Pseudoalteromonas sp. DL2-H2.2]MCF2906972.1 exonuclease SbcCD subunit D C-terminal domain-containing protein [Pseudoalteromonas sp. DL2-H2.2]